ncbi:hypothetical protein GCM10027612_00120 [Microbispora bryophytorum subsp. camponoti]
MLLGLNGTVVIAHGSSRARGVAAACELAARLSAQGIIARIGERVATTNKSHRRW